MRYLEMEPYKWIFMHNVRLFSIHFLVRVCIEYVLFSLACQIMWSPITFMQMERHSCRLKQVSCAWHSFPFRFTLLVPLDFTNFTKLRWRRTGTYQKEVPAYIFFFLQKQNRGVLPFCAMLWPSFIACLKLEACAGNHLNRVLYPDFHKLSFHAALIDFVGVGFVPEPAICIACLWKNRCLEDEFVRVTK